MNIRTSNRIKAVLVVILLAIWFACEYGASGDTVRSGKGAKFHERGTNGLTLCYRPANAASVTNAITCKQCQWAVKKAGAR